MIKKSIWDTWSQRHKTKYNKENNDNIFEANSGHLDVNYLIYNLKLDKELITRWKHYEPITKDNSTIKTIEINDKYVSNGFTPETFDSSDTIIIKSCTGTGKATTTAHSNDT